MKDFARIFFYLKIPIAWDLISSLFRPRDTKRAISRGRSIDGGARDSIWSRATYDPVHIVTVRCHKSRAHSGWNARPKKRGRLFLVRAADPRARRRSRWPPRSEWHVIPHSTFVRGRQTLRTQLRKQCAHVRAAQKKTQKQRDTPK